MPEGPGPQAEIRTGAVRGSRTRFLPLVFGAVALAMVCASFTVPWFSYSLKEGPDSRDITNLWTTKQSLDGEYRYDSEQGKETFYSWSEVTSESEAVRIFPYSGSLVAAGAVLSAGAIIGLALSLWKGKRGIAVAVALVLAAWSLFTPLFFMVHVQTGSTIHAPGGFPADSFFGREDRVDFQPGAPDNEDHTISTWGPDAGWYLALFAGIFGVLALATLVLPRPRSIFARAWRQATVAVMAVLCLMSAAVALYPGPVPPVQPGDGPIGCRATALGGNWSINITSGYIDAGRVAIQISDPHTGATMLESKVAYGTASNPDFTWTDRSGNGKLDAGDSILLKGTVNGQPNLKIQAGFKVQFLKGGSIIGTIKELPPY
jgi:hypothetical protein